MFVYLVQHGQAESKETNPERPLTARGRQDTQAVAALAKRLGLEVGQIRHSGKTRARETATILGEALGPADGVVAASGLGPLDDVKPVAKELSEASQPIMLVGHLPFMERLTGELIAGDSDSAPVKFQNSGIVCLTREDEDWQIAWIAIPEMAGVQSPVSIRLKRAYDAPAANDGYRVLVDRLWPRGVSKEDLEIDLWLKEIAPSDDLRKWFGHDPEKWDEFKKRYFKELDDQTDQVTQLAEKANQGRVTLLFAAKDEEFNNAVALKEFLQQWNEQPKKS